LFERDLIAREPVVTGVVRARNSADRIGPLLERLCSLVDDVVVLLDSRSTDGTEQIAKAFATVHQIEFDDRGIESLRLTMRLCTGDWVLCIDCDEWLDDSWSREALRELTRDRYATMYWFPRRWIVPPGDRYLSIAPWHPDWQPRLLRNLPTIYRLPDKVHDAGVVAGESRFIPTLPILHNNFLVKDRASRERTVELYMALNPENDCARQYLYESSYHESVPLTKHYPNVDRSGIPTVDAPHAADVRILDSPATMRAGESYPVYCSIANRSNRTMTAQSEFLWYADTFLTHHWIRVMGSVETAYSFGGAHHKLPRTIAPGSETGALVEVGSPRETGEYRLQIDLFEENVAWFSQAPEHGFHETVSVRVV
jgi:glycosyltransferase involved in cell wall biosynthesis